MDLIQTNSRVCGFGYWRDKLFPFEKSIVSISCDSNFKFWFSAEWLWLLNVLVQFSLEELLEKVCARVLVMSGIDVIPWPLMERWWIADDDFFPDILPIIFQGMGNGREWEEFMMAATVCKLHCSFQSIVDCSRHSCMQWRTLLPVIYCSEPSWIANA